MSYLRGYKMNVYRKVWIVSYFNNGDKEPTVVAFSNEKAARRYYNYIHVIFNVIYAAIDKVNIYNEFKI